MRRFLFILAFLIPVSGFSYDHFSHYRIQWQEGTPVLPNHRDGNHIRVDDLQFMAEEAGSYDAFLRKLKTRSPSLFEHFVLLHHSGSLQKASPEKPRTILFGDGLILAFAEDSEELERRIEIIQFEHDYSFSFHEIKFKAGQKPEVLNNPESCISCHGERPRPLWEPYDFWPKVYGSHLSRFGSVEEKNLYYSFASTDAADSILSYLVYPYIERNYNELIETFTQYVTMMGMMSMTHEWKSKQQLRPTLYTLAGVLTGCAKGTTVEAQIEGLKSFLPEEHWDSLEKDFPRIHKESKEVRSQFKNYLVSRYDDFFPNSESLFTMNHERLAGEVQTVAQMRFFLERLGVYLQDGALSQGANPFYMAVPGNYQMDLLSALFAVDSKSLNDLNPRWTNHDFKWPILSCDSLKREAKRSYETLDLASEPQGNPKKNLMGTCISCHVVEKTAPPIPFDDSSELSDWLKNGGMEKVRDRLNRRGGGQMPPAEFEWSESEKVQLLSIFETLGT